MTTASVKRLKEIRALDGNRVSFLFMDGRREDKTWEDRSRAESWTDEMREKARAQTRMENLRRKGMNGERGGRVES